MLESDHCGYAKHSAAIPAGSVNSHPAERNT